MMSMTYGVGGYLPDHPNGNIVEQTVDNGDGTGTRTTYDADGNVTSVEQLTGLPVPVEPEPDPVEALQAQVQAQQETIDALLAALGGGNE
jgi:YD repeat-containing protein